MKVSEILRGVILVGQVLVGQSSDAFKKIMSDKLIGVIKAFVLTQKFYEFRDLRAAIEFFIYFFLFALKGLEKGEKLIVIGTKEQIRIMKILQLTLLGFTADEMRGRGIDEKTISQVIRMCNHFAYKLPGTNNIA